MKTSRARIGRFLQMGPIKMYRIAIAATAATATAAAAVD